VYKVITPTSSVFNYKMFIHDSSTLADLNGSGIRYKLYEAIEKPDSTNILHTKSRISKKLNRLYKKRHE
jgi:hypothetical protein